MSISNNMLGRLSQAGFQAQQAPVQGAPDGALQRAGDRTFVTAEKLRPDSSIAHLFQRIQPSAAQVQAYVRHDPDAGAAGALIGQAPAQVPEGDARVGHDYSEMFTFSKDDKGQLIANLKPNTAKNTKLEDSNEAVAYRSFREAIKDEREIADQGKSGLRKFWEKVKDAFKKDTELRFQREDLGGEPAAGPEAVAGQVAGAAPPLAAPPVAAQVAGQAAPVAGQAAPVAGQPDAAAGAQEAPAAASTKVRMKISTSNSQSKSEGHEIDNSGKAGLKDRSLKWKILFGVGVAVGVVAAFALLPALGVVATGLAAGAAALAGSAVGLVTLAAGGAVLGKTLSYVKAPWWRSTLQGQIQVKERTDAQALGKSYAAEVRQQFVLDHKSEHGVDAPEGGWKKARLLDPKNLSDFMAIAAKNDPEHLKRKITAHLLAPKTSHLDPTTIANAKGSISGAFTNWFFTGNAKGHAEKTVSMVADQIAMGIMRGVGEGTMELLIAELSDELTERGGEAAGAMFNPTQEAFTQAVGYLKPGAAGYQIGNTRNILAQMDAYTALSKDAQTGLKREIGKGDNCVFGLANAAAFQGELQDLDRVIGLHQASLAQVQTLVGAKALLLGENNPPGTLGAVNEGLAGLLAEGLTEDQIQTQATGLKDQMRAIRQKIADPAATGALITEHAQALLDVMTEMDTAVDAATTYALTLRRAENAFSAEKPMRADIEQHLEALKPYEDGHGPNLNPLAVADVNYHFADANVRQTKLKDGGALITTAYAAADRFDALVVKGLEQSQEVDGFAAALSGDAAEAIAQAIAEQSLNVGRWTALGFSAPGDLAPAQAEGQWRSRIAGGALGLDGEQQAVCSRVLTKLGDAGHAALIAGLKAEQPAPTNLAGLLGQLQGKLGAEGAEGGAGADAAQNALDSYQLAQAALPARSAQAAPLTLALHAGQGELIAKHQALLQVHQNLSRTFDSDLGRKLYEWASQAPAADNAAQIPLYPPDALNAGQFLEIISRFLQDKSINAAPTLQALQTAKAALDGQRSLEEVAQRADKLQAISRQDLDVLQDLTDKFSSRQAGEVELAIQARRQEAEAARRALSQLIAPGAVGGSQSVEFQQVVNDAAALIEPERAADFAQITSALKQDLALRKNIAVDQKQLEREISASAEELKMLTGFSGSTEALIAKVMADPELGQELSIVLHAYHQVQAMDGLPGLAHELSLKEMIEGANRIGLLKSAAGDALTAVDGDSNLRLKERNLLKDRLGLKTSAELEKLFKQPVNANFVRSFVYEERAHQALMALDGAPPKGSMNAQEQRILIENTATDQVQTEKNHALYRNQLLNDGNLGQLRQSLQTAFAGRADALKALIADSQVSFNAANSDYLMAQIQALEEKVPDTATLRSAIGEAKTGTLINLGKTLMEADQALKMSPDQVKNVYTRGMYEASLKNLKWFDPKKFSAERPGFFGRMLFRVLGRGKRLPRMLRDKDLNAINTAVQNIAVKGKNRGQLSSQIQSLNTSIAALRKSKDALLADPKKLTMALQLLAFEQLEQKASANASKLTQEDITAITSRWQALFPDSKIGSEYFDTSELPFKAGDTLESIQNGLGKDFDAEVSKALLGIRQQQQDISELHQSIKKSIDAMPDAAGKPWYFEKGPVALALAGIGLGSVDMAVVDRMTKAGVPEKQTLALLANWKNAHSAIKAQPTDALRQGRVAKHELGDIIKDLKAKGFDAQATALEDFRDMLEDNLLDALPAPGPQTLQALTQEELTLLSIQDPDQGFDNGQVDADDLRTGFVQAGNEPVRGAKPEAKTVPKAAAKPSAEPTAPQSKAKAEPPKPSGGLFGGFFSGNKK